MPNIPAGNRLHNEASPYLQQHADNPVHWYPWGEAAHSLARQLDRPIFLSIGYSACHWCHVMRHECFSDPAIAEIMNRHYINIKVDREERPDVDGIYQTVCQIVTNHGGWPLSVFLTPNLQPFYIGTYFPPADRHGLPGFPRVLEGLAAAWAKDPERLRRVAAEWTAALQQTDAPPPGGAVPAGRPEQNTALDPGAATLTAAQPSPGLHQAAAALLERIDRTHGGFAGAPKFPNATALDLMLRAHANGGASELLPAVTLTLRKMALGGIYDQLGGGFHRYAVDGRWAVPHFEKMLYDNALLVPLYAAAWQLTGEVLFHRIVTETLAYVQREMTAPAGGFYSTQDADSEGEEGKFFVWTPAQIEAAVGQADAKLLQQHLGVSPEGNFEHGTTVLHVAAAAETLVPANTTAALGTGTDTDTSAAAAAEISLRLQRAKQRLLAARTARPKPFRDEKVITGWNGLMITALARAARALAEPAYAAAAARAADFILNNLSRPDGGLYRRYLAGATGDATSAGLAASDSEVDLSAAPAPGRVAIAGYLDDYAFFAQGLIDLYECTFDQKYLQAAIRLTNYTLQHFYDTAAGGFFLTAAAGEPLIHRPQAAFDSALPAGAGVAVMNLLRLYPFTGKEQYRAIAAATLRAYQPLMARNPMLLATMISALGLQEAGATEVTIVALDNSAAAQWVAIINKIYRPHLILTLLTPEMGTDTAAPIWSGKTFAAAQQPTAYVCRNFTCSAPVTRWADLEKLL